MKKVTNISLVGIAFSIEEDAYEALKAYLAAIEDHFSASSDGKEILADIESGIEEKLTAALETPKGVVTLDMVERVMADMGRVEDIVAGEESFVEADASDESGNEKQESFNKEKSSGERSAAKRLFRDTDNAILGGVAGGVANYLGFDPVIVRLAFVIATFINGFGILAYLILWLIVPPAKTTTEKYQMRGEPVTLTNIADRVQDEVERLRTKDMSGARSVWKGIRDVLDGLFGLLGSLARLIATVFRVVVGFVVMLVGILVLAATSSVFTIMFFVLDPSTTDPVTRALITELTSSTAGYVLLIAGFAAVCIPIILLIKVGVSLLTLRNRFATMRTLALGVVWIVACTVAASALVVMLPTLTSTVANARTASSSEERAWHEVQLETMPEEVLVRGHVSLHLVEDDIVSLRILASEDTYREVHIAQYARTLEVDRDTHFRLCFFCDTYAPYVVELRAPNVENIQVRGDGAVYLEGVEGNTLDLYVSGAFDVVAEDLAVQRFTVDVRGANTIALAGTAASAEFDLSGASEMYASAFVAEDISLDVSGGNMLYLQPTQLLHGKLRGGNGVRYVDNALLEIHVERLPESANSVEVLKNESKVDFTFVERVRSLFRELPN